ncbi:hypothetical protein COK68_29640 [Priestia megaterium]|jgi:hypothetical protein|uniref:hypothetical protein n=1 Tax=Priestia megaterium TaxID=1404 RepID=UPI000BF40FF7|nr:hypothetical protein [Priestia megaterium]PFT48683.1 hypothetical protein COK68_29640 [Priestia megaterium]
MGGLCCDYDLKEETFINKNRSFLLITVVINIAIWIFVQEQMTNAKVEQSILSIDQPTMCK